MLVQIARKLDTPIVLFAIQFVFVVTCVCDVSLHTIADLPPAHFPPLISRCASILVSSFFLAADLLDPLITIQILLRYLSKYLLTFT